MSSEEKKVNENAAAEEAEKVEVNAEQVEDAVKEEKETEKTDKNEKAEKSEKKGFFKNKNKEVEELGQKLADMQDKFQRTLAEFDNFRKRTSKEKASMYDDGVRDTIEKLLPIFDNLERAIASVDGKVDENDPLLKGVKMTDKQLKEILAAMGVEEIKALGEKFDPNLHAAVAHVEDENFGENEVVLDMMKGYKYKEKVIRHSMVKVAN
ncbi:nucleotide exchange factor GrpE [Anaerotignum sp. MSJ-24]|uniref:nucleotide exchange factor GrpE n=1 Tax=Anaerotignum sp. MSJ-24 TaxID=2841521 RepID=UPI001C10A685|nr:nucleotide exchange factor GrpE [Anaerotignum sp. MSJ-24]MBD9218732.1 nucleotide exchange factor GrpE [Clostridiales bacterium]MBU5465126.1 nucleotide exchange factor GrpE [Anaerotignum sp. MSJ-24]